MFYVCRRDIGGTPSTSNDVDAETTLDDDKRLRDTLVAKESHLANYNNGVVTKTTFDV